MAVTLILPNGAEVTSDATPYCMTDAEARTAWRKGAGPAAAAAAHAEAEALAGQLAINATPEALAKAWGAHLPALEPLPPDWTAMTPRERAAFLDRREAWAEELRRLNADRAALADMARQAHGRPLTRDPLALLHRRGSLPLESFRAGQEIAQVFQAISAAVTPRVTASYWERAPKGPPVEDWPPTLRAAYRTRYVPWRDWAGTQPVRKRGSRHTLGDLTLLVAGEGHCPEVAAGMLGMDKRTLLRRLQDSLWWYASHAGWVRDVTAAVAA